MSLALASQIIGFISFGITLATLLGVYRDLISTMRNADTHIPLMLGNLRQEIQAEQVLLRQRVEEGDAYDVFPKSRRRRSRRKHNEASQLLENSLSNLWQQFKNVERPFLIRNPARAEKVQRGDYWGESDVDEKPSARPSPNERRFTNRMGMAEAGLSSDEERYYHTDLIHRFIWWQSRSTVIDMLDQVQRIQIGRIERDTFEADELIKRCFAILDRRDGRRRRQGGGSSTGSDDSRGGAGGRVVTRRKGGLSRPASTKPSNRRFDGTRERSRDGRAREVLSTRRDLDERGQSGLTSGRRRRASEPRYEYEIVQPGRIYVDVDNGGRRNEVEYADQTTEGPPARRDSFVNGVRTSVSLREPSRERRRD